MAKRWSGGHAFSPERELQVFREMALKGEHLTGTAMAGSLRQVKKKMSSLT